MNFALSVITFTLASFLPVPPAGVTVFTWKDGGGNSYSDVPKQLHPDQSQILNLRTLQTKPAVKPKPAVDTNADSAKENEKDIAEKNGQLEEEKKKLPKPNGRTKKKTAGFQK